MTITCSIIIPVKPGGHTAACEHIKKIMPDDHMYEILLAEGSAPSQQRNRAAREASGDILYFLDDDSLILTENLDFCSSAMSDPAVAVVGGPSITPPDDSPLQKLFGVALASAFGSGGVCNRYRVQGETRETTDKELILCNLAVRSSVFKELGGFNECLYPNEENEFLERVISAGYKLLHDPAMIVFRSQRQTLRAFIRQMFNYGRGRGEQTLLSGSFSIVSFIPLFFIIYLAFAPLFASNPIIFLPLSVYMLLTVFFTVLESVRSRSITTFMLILIYPLMHIVNGIGLFFGLTGGKPAPLDDPNIVVKRIKPLGQNFEVWP